MLRPSSFAALLALLAIPLPAAASTFDATSGALTIDPAASLSISFDARASFGALPARTFTRARTQGYSTFTETQDAIADAAFVKDGIEGAGAFRVGGDRGILLGDAASLSALASGRFELRMWARADGAMPRVAALYSRKPLEAKDLGYPTGQLVAIRTGRATSDGWIELSTGPVDGTSAFGLPLAGILISAEGDARDGGSFLVDALEAIRAPGDFLSGGACTLAQESTVCKSGAVCVEGACVDSALVYGALPSAETRKDVIARATMYLTHFQMDRHATDAAIAGFAKEMPPVADAADTPAAFFRPYLASFGRIRAAHTYAPMPEPYSRLAAGATTRLRYYENELNACFGLVEKDLLGGGHGYGVFATASPSPLAVGDVVETVDGEPVDAWLARTAAEHLLLAADPDSDRALAAEELSSIVLRHGRTLGVQRCTGGGACQAIAIDLDQARKDVANIKPLQCTPRFQLGVNVPTGVDTNAYEAAIMDTAADGTVTLFTNGEPSPAPEWVSTAKQAFSAATDRLIVDKRRGDGGGGDALATWAGELRRPSDFGLYFVQRIDYAAIDGAPGFLSDLLSKCSGSAQTGHCAYGGLETYPAFSGSLPRKTAWLVTIDGSASDMSTYFAKGASGVRIFGPNRTMGLFGGLGVMAGFLPGWSAGSVQFSDTRTGLTAAERVSGAWHSGRGVEPDELIAQKQSDLLAGRDTMLERAKAWLAEP